MDSAQRELTEQKSTKNFQWLKSSGLKAEMEGFVVAAQDQSLATRYYQHKIIKNGTGPKCRLSHEFDESIEHIISGCPVLAKKEYLERHDKALIYIHWKICKYYQIQVTSKWYEHKPSKVAEGKDVAMLWDMPINTDKEIKANRPDIVIKDKSKSICTLINRGEFRSEPISDFVYILKSQSCCFLQQ